MAFNLFSIILLGIGAVLLAYGFNRFKKIKLIEETPRSKIRSIAMGLVEIHGKVKALATITTPFSQEKCVYYRYEIKEYRERVVHDNKGRSHVERSWELVASGQQHTAFLALDDTGEVIVQPSGAEFHVDVKRVFLQKAGIFGAFNTIVGALKNWDKKQTSMLDVAKWNLKELDSKNNTTFINHVGDRKYYEWFIRPDENLYVLGTADHDSEEKIEIRRGENEKTFLISDKSEKELLKGMKGNMWLVWVIGSVLVVAGVYVLLSSLGIM